MSPAASGQRRAVSRRLDDPNHVLLSELDWQHDTTEPIERRTMIHADRVAGRRGDGGPHTDCWFTAPLAAQSLSAVRSPLGRLAARRSPLAE